MTDVVARHRGPLASGTDTASVIRILPGGAGANVACWAAHWGCADVRLLGRVGAESAAWHERELTTCGVRPRLVVDPQASTGTVICLVDTGAAAERTFLTDSGASLRLAPEDWSEALLDGVGRLHLSGYLLFSETGRALVRTALASARARRVPVSLDPASAGFLMELGVGRFLPLVEGVDVLLPSRDEACLLTGLLDGAAAAAELSRHVPLVVAKQGADGALVARDGAVLARVPSAPAAPGTPRAPATPSRERSSPRCWRAPTPMPRRQRGAEREPGRYDKWAADHPHRTTERRRRRTRPAPAENAWTWGFRRGEIGPEWPSAGLLLLSPPCRDQRCRGQVHAARGDVRQVPVDVLVGREAFPDELAADLPYRRGLQDSTGN